jgi:hypothetical protein
MEMKEVNDFIFPERREMKCNDYMEGGVRKFSV